MKTADLYIRVSTDEQADRGYSQRDQEERLRSYCKINNIAVRKVIFEDHSAKSFKRPEWQKLLVDLRKNRGQSDLVLFIKWDRFSRNAGDAYAMINTLRKLGVEPQAVEQPLDLSIPENKMMLAFYLAAPEVENDRRALNVFHGMRRAKKEGRWMAMAPIGYINTTINGRKCIIPHPERSKIIIYAFETIAEGIKNVEQVWRDCKDKGLNCSKNAFWNAIRNPAYYGKIVVPKYKNEPEMLVDGLHDAIISEEMFYKAQDAISGRKRIYSVTNASEILFPLRGHLECPNCRKTLTASSSKGKRKYYHYYHCNSRCGFRHNSGVVNSSFYDLLSSYQLADTAVTITNIIFKQIFDSKINNYTAELKEAKKQIANEQERIVRARELLIEGDIDGGEYREIKQESENKISRIESRIKSLEDVTPTYNPEIINKLCNIADLYEKGDIDKKNKIMGSIFKEKLVFNGEKFRTPLVNSIVHAMHVINSKLRGNKKGTNPLFSDLSQEVIPLVRNSNTFMQDYRILESLVA